MGNNPSRPPGGLHTRSRYALDRDRGIPKRSFSTHNPRRKYDDQEYYEDDGLPSSLPYAPGFPQPQQAQGYMMRASL